MAVRNGWGVSTHSRLKAAGGLKGRPFYLEISFNTQPPEGGWANVEKAVEDFNKFQHTAA